MSLQELCPGLAAVTVNSLLLAMSSVDELLKDGCLPVQGKEIKDMSVLRALLPVI